MRSGFLAAASLAAAPPGLAPAAVAMATRCRKYSVSGMARLMSAKQTALLQFMSSDSWLPA